MEYMWSSSNTLAGPVGRQASSHSISLHPWHPLQWPAPFPRKPEPGLQRTPSSATRVRLRSPADTLKTRNDGSCELPFALMGWWLSSRLAQMSVDQLLDELHAFEFHDLHILFYAAVDRHADLPGSRKNVLILDRSFIIQAIRTGRADAFHDVQFVAMKITGPIEPAHVVETG